MRASKLSDQGGLLLILSSSRGSMTVLDRRSDPVRLEPIKTHFKGVSRTMLILDSNITPLKSGEETMGWSAASNRSLRRLLRAVWPWTTIERRADGSIGSIGDDRLMMISMSMVLMVLVDGKEESNKGIMD